MFVADRATVSSASVFPISIFEILILASVVLFVLIAYFLKIIFCWMHSSPEGIEQMSNVYKDLHLEQQKLD